MQSCYLMCNIRLMHWNFKKYIEHSILIRYNIFLLLINFSKTLLSHAWYVITFPTEEKINVREKYISYVELQMLNKLTINLGLEPQKFALAVKSLIYGNSFIFIHFLQK